MTESSLEQLVRQVGVLEKENAQLRRKQVAINDAKELYLKIFQDFPALIWRAGTDKLCDYFNSTWLSFTGRTLEQELGNGWAEGVHPDDLARCLQIYTAAFDRRESFSMEYRLRHHSGEYRWILDCGQPYFDLDGEFLGYIGSCYDITESKQQKEHLQRLSTTDRLTQVANRFKLETVLQEEIERQERYQHPFSIIMLDVDFFKQVNDRYGHKAGDAVLAGMADLVRKNIRASDVLGRWGGEEFIVICPETDIHGAAAMAEKMRAAIEAHKFPQLPSRTASFGVAAHVPGQSVEQLMARVDRALYRAKENGRNRVEIAGPLDES